MKKIDFKKEWKDFYKPSKKEPSIVEVPARNFLMINGQGNPNTSQIYQDSVSALFSLAYALKFAVRKHQEVDYSVLPLEGLWWVEDMQEFTVESKDDWLWTMMILQPEYVTPGLVEEMTAEVQKKKNPPLLEKVRYEEYAEGLSVQLMHAGPYTDEAPNIERMHQYAFDKGYELRSKHHEIYLKGPPRSAPENWLTVLRQPIQPA